MKRNLITASSLLLVALALSCSSSSQVAEFRHSLLVSANAGNGQIESSVSFGDRSSLPAATVDANAERRSQVYFQDQTQEIVSRARQLIEKNEREGAVLDQRWYGFRRFGKYQDLILGATNVIFCGGLEADVRSELGSQYESIPPLEENQDPGEIRFYAGNRSDGSWDFIIVGQNGREVALKTVIRLLYMSKFLDDQIRRKYRVRLQSFHSSLKVLTSSVSARQEFISFFERHGIREPDAVLIGFMGDSASLLDEERVGDPKLYSDESLRVSWYSNANGKKLLLVSINGNRIFASRAGQLIEAIFEISPSRPPSIAFLGSAGSIEAPELVWKIVTPVSVTNGDLHAKGQGELVHLLRNRALERGSIQTAHASVESVVVETTDWARNMKKRGIRTIDQELLHVIQTVNSSRYGAETELFVGILVTDNISSNAAVMDVTLERAEETISQATELRREFLSQILKTIGVLKTTHSPRLRYGDHHR
jgi:hypothetical protein